MKLNLLVFILFFTLFTSNTVYAFENSNNKVNHITSNQENTNKSPNESTNTNKDLTDLSFEEIKNELPNYYEEYYTEQSINNLNIKLETVKNNWSSYSKAEKATQINLLSDCIKNLEYKKYDTPQIYISTKSKSCISKDYLESKIVIIDKNDGTNDTISDNCEIKIRGNSSTYADKKSYSLKLKNKHRLFGLSKDKKWALISNAFDKTLIRNKLFYDFSTDLGLSFINKSQFVDIWINGEFRGNYLLSEGVDVDKERVNIDIKDNDFLLELEKSREKDDIKYIETKLGLRFALNEPEDPDENQLNKIKTTIDSVEDAISSKDYDTYSKIIDVDSFVNYYIVEEFTKNIDILFSSTRFYFKDGKIFAGPVWDLDISSGNASSKKYPIYNNMNTTKNSFEGLKASSFKWFNLLLKDKKFYDLVKKRYETIQPIIKNLYEDNELGKCKIDQLINENISSFERNNAIWDVSNACYSYERAPDSTYEENVGYLKYWLKNRNNYLLDYYKLTDNTQTQPSSYSVKFTDKDNNIISDTIYSTSTKIEAPNPPEVEGFKFTKWDRQYKYIINDTVIHPIYIENTFDNVTPLYIILSIISLLFLVYSKKYQRKRN